MKRFLATFIALAMIFALAGFGGAALADGTHEDAGYYNLKSMIEDGETTDASLLALFGMTASLELREDGTATFNMFGQTTELEWEDGSLTGDGETATYTLEGDTLTLDMGEGAGILVFEKGEPAAASAEPAPAEEVSDALPGTYKLSGLVSEGEETSAEELAMMEQMGLTYALYLYEDGTGSFLFFGQGLDLVWNETAFTISGLGENDEDVTIEYTRDGTEITADIEGTVLTFTKTSDSVEIPENSISVDELLTALFGAMMGESSDEPAEEPVEEPSEEPEEGEYYAEPLAEGDIGDYHVAIVGAEAFTDSEDKDAIRVFYEFTNNSDEETSAWTLTYEAEQDEYELVTTYASYTDDAPEYGNDSLKVQPGVMILCEKEFKFKPTGAPVTFTVSDWFSDEELSYTFEDPSDLPGRPMEWKPVLIEDPQTYIDYPLSGECDDFAVNITNAEIVPGNDADVLRLYFEVTNKTEEASSPLWILNMAAYQDGIQLDTDYYADSVPEDSAYYEDIEPGDTVLVADTWTLRTDSPVEIVFFDYDLFDTVVVAAATVNPAE